MSYSVLLGSDDEQVQRKIRSQLSELPDIHLADVVRSSSDVIPLLGANDGIDCVLLHESLGPLPALDLAREVTARYPYLAIVLIVSDPRTEVLTAAMESGARGVVSVNPSLEDLETRIGNAGDWSRTMRQHMGGYNTDRVSGKAGMMVAIAGAKGGTGTTTVAVHLALAASNARRTVCLVDMDLQAGDLPTYLDITHRRSIADLAEAADDLNPTALADALFAHRLGPHILLAPREGERAEDIDGRAARQILGSLRSRYDLVIVDCGAYTTEASAMAAELADRVLITCSPDLPALRGARRLVEMWERLQVRKRDDVLVLLVKHSRGSEIQPDFARKVLRLKLAQTAMPASFRALEAATNTGSPGDVTDPTFRRAIGQLLGEIGVLHATASSVESAPKPPSQGRRPPKKGKKRARSRHESGQATVEFIGILPFVLIIVIVLWESLMLGMAMMTASHGANEGARAAAVGESPKQVRKAVRDHMTSTWADRATIRYTPGSDKVVVTLKVPALMPRIETPWTMSASAEVVDETGGNGGAGTG